MPKQLGVINFSHMTFQFVHKKGDFCLRGANGNPAYLQPNSNSMQKPVGGLSVLALFSTKSTLKKRRGKGTEKMIGAYETVVKIEKRS